MKPSSLLKFRAVPPAWLAPSVLLMWALHHYIPVVEWLPTPWNYLGFLALVASLVITGAAAKGLAARKTTIYPGGEPSALVTDGLYAHTRNPMYLGMALLLVWIALWFGTLTPLCGVVFFAAVVEALFIRPEERLLRDHFGEAFTAYCRQVRRWL